jgi:hypothetical protein
VSAEIINLPERRRDARLTAGVEQFAREIERLLAQANPAAEFGELLDMVERLSDRLMDIGYLLLDEETKRDLQTSFDELSAKLAHARQALDAPDISGSR